MEPLQLESTVACPPAHAFAVWTERTSLWWPKGHSVSGDPELEVTFEPPHRLAYHWHLRQERADATHVEISFTPAAEGTDVTIVHAGWERLGARGEGLRERNQRGWGGLLPHFAAAAA